MTDFRRSVLGLFQQCVDAVNNAVMHVSNVTRNKMDEIALQNQRKELLENLANTVYEQWQQGEKYPESLTSILEQIKALNEQIDTIAKRDEKAADDIVKQAEKDVGDIEMPGNVEPVQGYETPEMPDEVIPTIEVKAEEMGAPVWPETPVMSDAPQITVQEEDEPEK